MSAPEVSWPGWALLLFTGSLRTAVSGGIFRFKLMHSKHSKMSDKVFLLIGDWESASPSVDMY